jgi:hypothetical protein
MNLQKHHLPAIGDGELVVSNENSANDHHSDAVFEGAIV